jgi:hypothetical protein
MLARNTPAAQCGIGAGLLDEMLMVEAGALNAAC